LSPLLKNFDSWVGPLAFLLLCDFLSFLLFFSFFFFSRFLSFFSFFLSFLSFFFSFLSLLPLLRFRSLQQACICEIYDTDFFSYLSSELSTSESDEELLRLLERLRFPFLLSEPLTSSRSPREWLLRSPLLRCAPFSLLRSLSSPCFTDDQSISRQIQAVIKGQ